jgi:BirA family transcriptional regulator, biotin operon repressor / biotin---[acetyl-CoA-carboxylase] ligase
MKSHILKVLRESGGVVSGNTLCTRLGASRVAVWKHIQKLQELGYDIESGAKGYRLRSSPDSLHPWEFPGREERMVYLAEVPSTMDVAKDLARKGCPAFTTVVAGRQIQGRGRLRRVWSSEEGGLYFTVVLRPRIPAVWSSRVNFLASLTLASILRQGCGVAAGLKWPNDILVEDRKLCGLLSEMESEGEQVNFINIGIGLNVNNDPPKLDPPAVSLKGLLGRAVARRDILSRFLDAMEQGIAAEPWDRVIGEWKTFSVTLNRPVRIVTTKGETRGVAMDVGENGALLLRQADGTIATVLYGDCFLAGADTSRGARGGGARLSAADRK